MHITLTRAVDVDIAKLQDFQRAAVTGAFVDNEIHGETESLQEEIEKQHVFLERVVSGEESVELLVAICNDRIVGTTGFRNASPVIREHLSIADTYLPEITGALVLPEFQGKGVGTILHNAVLLLLTHRGFSEFCLDGGYEISQQYWIRRFGDPTVTVKDFYGEGLHYMIWKRRIEDYPARFHLVYY